MWPAYPMQRIEMSTLWQTGSNAGPEVDFEEA